ncbi:hypothetical protein D3C77_107380 [compost metagenome]
MTERISQEFLEDRPMSKPIKNNAVLADISRLEQANAMMRSVNHAIARDDIGTLAALGFTHPHIEQLKRTGGFRSTSIGQKSRLITRLRKEGDAYDQ